MRFFYLILLFPFFFVELLNSLILFMFASFIKYQNYVWKKYCINSHCSLVKKSLSWSSQAAVVDKGQILEDFSRLLGDTDGSQIGKCIKNQRFFTVLDEFLSRKSSLVHREEVLNAIKEKVKNHEELHIFFFPK
jgi:hypothetical protein